MRGSGSGEVLQYLNLKSTLRKVDFCGVSMNKESWIAVARKLHEHKVETVKSFKFDGSTTEIPQQFWQKMSGLQTLDFSAARYLKQCNDFLEAVSHLAGTLKVITLPDFVFDGEPNVGALVEEIQRQFQHLEKLEFSQPLSKKVICGLGAYSFKVIVQLKRSGLTKDEVRQTQQKIDDLKRPKSDVVDDGLSSAVGGDTSKLTIATCADYKEEGVELHMDKLDSARGIGDHTVVTTLEFNEPRAYLDLARMHEISKGEGIKIAILDSGVNRSHKLLRDKIIKTESFIDTEHGCIDPTKHGTHCAGIIAGEHFLSLEKPAMLGVAPEAKLLIYKVVSEGKSVADGPVIAGIRRAIEDGADIISMSLSIHHPSHGLLVAINDALSAGKIVVAAASNDGYSKRYNIGYPGLYGNVICVGSHNKNGQPSDFTSVGREVDFIAPGEHIWSTGSADHLVRMSGTSMAAPFVAGLCAILLSYDRKNADARGYPRQIENCAIMKALLKEVCSNAGVHDQVRGYGSLDLMRLLQYGYSHFRNVVENL